MNKHLYVQQVLKERGISISAGNSKILDYKEKDNLYNLKDFETKYTLHKFVSLGNNKIRLIESYDDLMRMGFQISRQRAINKFFFKQQVEYFLVKTSSNYPHIGYIPQEHKIEYNYAENWIRLIGRNSTGKKVYLKRRVPKTYHRETKLEDYPNIYEQYIQDMHPFTYQEEEEKISIPEIPVLLTEQFLVCIPQMKDNPTIGVFGKKGMGKSLFLHGLADRVHHKWHKRVAILNDGVAFQTKSWSLPWDYDKHKNFIKWLEQIGETTRPLSCVYLFPSVYDLTNIEFENEVGFKIALPWRDIMEQPNQFFEGTKDEMHKSEKYVKNLIFDNKENVRPDGLIYVKNLDDIQRLVNEKTWVEQTVISGKSQLIQRQEAYTIPETSRTMIFGLLKELYISKIFDVNTNIPSKWIVEYNGEKFAFYPWNACLFADIVPILITNKLRFNKYYAPYERFILNDIFKNQDNDIIKRNNIELWCFIDEIQDILRHLPSLQSFTMINKEARNNRMGIVYATQDTGDITRDIWITTDYVMSFKQMSTQASEIANNYDLMKYQQKDLIKLKKYEAMIAGKLLVTYDAEGNREEIDDGTPFKGIIFPSVSQHSAPKAEGI
ncbi:hypothetical protein HY448_01610 [Candidatus Pacearchaeota archaeon]|nr:hypothetical protein [Candidatus Pacearchaeota archaeon]